MLEQGLRLRFADLNGCAAVARAELCVYYVTLDGFGQQRKHLLLLQDRLPQGSLKQQQEEEQDGAEGGAGESGDAAQADEAATVPNALLAHVGPGLTALLQDLFQQLGGPNLRGKVSHGEAAFVPGDALADATGEGEGAAQEQAAAAPAVYRLPFAGVIALAARERAQGVSFGRDSGDPTARGAAASLAPPLSAAAAALVAECLAFAEGYQPVFTPGARLNAALRSAAGAVDALEALERCFSVCVAAASASANAEAASSDEMSVSVLETPPASGAAGAGVVTQFTERRSKLAGGEEMARAVHGPLGLRLGRLASMLSASAARRRAQGGDGLEIMSRSLAAAEALAAEGDGGGGGAGAGADATAAAAGGAAAANGGAEAEDADARSLAAAAPGQDQETAMAECVSLEELSLPHLDATWWLFCDVQQRRHQPV